MPSLNTIVYWGPQNELLVNWSYWKQLLLVTVFFSVVICIIFLETTSILLTMIYIFYHRENKPQNKSFFLNSHCSLCSNITMLCHLYCVSCSKSCSLLVSEFCLEADHNLCTINLGQLGAAAQPLISMTCFSGGTRRPNNTCIRALTHVSQLWLVLLLLCPTVCIMSLREEVREP